MALRAVGETADFHRIDQLLTTYQTAFKQMRAVYTEALSAKTLGVAPHTELYHQLATLREQLGRFDEARAWHRLVLDDIPDDAAPCRLGTAQVTLATSSCKEARGRFPLSAIDLS